MILRMLWWRIRYAAWYIGWRMQTGVAQWRTIHGVNVGVAPVLDDKVAARAFERVEAAFGLIAAYEPRRLRRIARDIQRVWVRRAAYAPAYFIEELSLCVIDREFLIAEDTAPVLIALAIIHEATHARLFKNKIPYTEAIRPRVEAACDGQGAAFARRLPDGESIARRIVDGRPADPTHWSNANLDRRQEEAKRVEIEAARRELEDSDLPLWLKRLLRRVILSRAA